MLTKRQLIELIENDEHVKETLIYGGDATHEGYSLKHEEQFGGEGQGDSYWYVFSVSKDNNTEYWEVPGWYASHQGSETNPEEMFRVVKKQNIIDCWEAV